MTRFLRVAILISLLASPGAHVLAQTCSKQSPPHTVEIFIAGRELRNWRNATVAAVQAINRRPAQADLAVSLRRLAGSSLPVEINARAAQPATLFVALYENGLATDVKAGENRAVTLKHDYVVCDWIGPVAVDVVRGQKTARVPLPRAPHVPANAVARNLGVAAFVQGSSGDILQALSMPLCN